MRRNSQLWRCLAMVGITVSLFLLVAMPAMAQVKIRFQTWQWGETPSDKVLQAFQEDFNKANPGIEVVRDESRLADKESVFTVQSQAKAAPDVAHFMYRPIPLFAARGYIMDLTPFIEKEGGEKFLAQWDQHALEACKYNGKIYCLPDFVNPLTLLYNTVHYKEAGLDPNKPPANWTEFSDYAKKLTRAGRYGLGLVGGRSDSLMQRFNNFLWGAGGEYLTPDGKHSALDTPEALEGFRFYVELFTKLKVVPPGVVEQGAQDVRTLMAHEKVSMNIAVPQSPGIIQALNPNMKVREVMAAAPLPVGKKRVATAEYGLRVISSYTKNPEAAWKVYMAWYEKNTQLRNFKIAGLISARLDVRTSSDMANDKFVKVYLSQTPYVKLEPLIPEWPKIGDAMMTAIQEAFSGIKTPEQALKDAHIATNRALGVQ